MKEVDRLTIIPNILKVIGILHQGLSQSSFLKLVSLPILGQGFLKIINGGIMLTNVAVGRAQIGKSQSIEK